MDNSKLNQIFDDLKKINEVLDNLSNSSIEEIGNYEEEFLSLHKELKKRYVETDSTETDSPEA